MSIPEFDKNELEVLGEYPGVESDLFYVPGPGTEKLNTPITPHENWDRFFARNEPYWVPDGTYDINFIVPAVVPDNPAFECGGTDALGIKWIVPDNNPLGGAMPDNDHHLLSEIGEWREKIIWPDVDSWGWEKSAKEYEALDRSRLTAAFLVSSLWERMLALLGFENAAVSFYEDPDETHAFIDRLCEYNLDVAAHLIKYLHIDMLEFSDDWASNAFPFVSPDTIREFFSPHVKRIVDLCHENDVYFMHHCCGNSSSLVPIMIEEGVDIWQMNYEAVKPYILDTMNKHDSDILFDAYLGYVNPYPDETEAFKQKMHDDYRLYGAAGTCSLTMYDFAGLPFDVRKYAYEQARLTALDK